MSATKEALIKRLNAKVAQAAKTDEVQKAVQDLSQQQLNELYGDRPRNFENGDKELNFLARQYVMQDYKRSKWRS